MVPTDCIVALQVDETPEGYSSLTLPEEYTIILSAPLQVAVDIGSRTHYVAIHYQTLFSNLTYVIILCFCETIYSAGTESLY
jgi:hypothetical protein